MFSHLVCGIFPAYHQPSGKHFVYVFFLKIFSQELFSEFFLFFKNLEADRNENDAK